MSKLTSIRAAAAIVAAAGVILAAPGTASAGLVGDLVKGLDDTVKGLLNPGGGSGSNPGTGGSATGGAPPPTPSPAPPPASPPAVTPQGQPSPAPAAAPTPSPTAGTPPNYTPPAHGTDQHGQGTGAVVDLTPEDGEPLPYEPGGGSEDVVVGSSRGALDPDGAYHGHVTILALLGNELLAGADTGPGETSDGPAGDLNALLADVCSQSGLCLSVLDVRSETTETGSTNSFSVAGADLSLTGTQLLNLGAVQTTGTIEESGGCRTATGSSQIANVGALAIGADAINTSSLSQACADGSTAQVNESSVLGLNGTGVPLPEQGCEDGTPDTVFSVPIVNLALEAVCNADDSGSVGGLQIGAPYGAREGLTAFVLPVLGDTAKATAGSSESHALAPANGDDGDDGDDNGDDGDDGDGDDGGDDGNRGDQGRDDSRGDQGRGDESAARSDDGPGDDRDGDGVPTAEDECPAVSGSAANDGCPAAGPGAGGGPSAAGTDRLPFTGADIAVLGGIGLAIAASGLALMALLDRRRRHPRLGGS